FSVVRKWPKGQLITLASLIHRVPRIKLGTSVLVLPQRNAILVAKQVAALDLLSGSRLLLGVGVAWREAEFKYLGAWVGPVQSGRGVTQRLVEGEAVPNACRRNDLPCRYTRPAGRSGKQWHGPDRLCG